MQQMHVYESILSAQIQLERLRPIHGWIMDSIVNAVNVDQIKGEAASMHVSPDILMRNLEETVKSRLFITFCSIRVLFFGKMLFRKVLF